MPCPPSDGARADIFSDENEVAAMLIEFLGLPGAGKSTLSHNVAHLLSERGYTVDEATYEVDHDLGTFQRILVKLSGVASYVCRNPIHAANDVARILAAQQETLADARRSIFNWLFINSIVSQAHAGKRIVILDQGLAQAVWSVGLAARRQAWLDLCLDTPHRKVPKPDLIVAVKAKTQTVCARLRSREKRISRIDHLGSNLAILRRAHDHVDAIVQAYGSAAVSVLGVENDTPKDLSLNARRVVDAVVALSEDKSEELQAQQTRYPLARWYKIAGARGWPS